MRLVLFAFGKLKTPGLRQTADYYQLLIRPWISLEEVELKPLSVPSKDPATRLSIQAKEGQLLLQAHQRQAGGGPLYLLDEKGRSQPTRQWAEQAEKWEGSGSHTISFCIGSSLGFSEEVRKRAAGQFSLGPQTLSHELARVVLLEQLYRTWSVLRKHPYHNEGS